MAFDSFDNVSGPWAAPGVCWEVSSELVDYNTALASMEARAQAIALGQAPERLWLLEHPPLYTAGTSARAQDLLKPDMLPVYQAGRGGQYTYHGPGQRVVYVQLNLAKRGRDVRAFVARLEAWMIATLADFGIQGVRRCGRVGIWVVRSMAEDAQAAGEDKIGALGVRLRRWVSLHGLSINVNPNLTHFSGIVPCGIAQHGVTSLQALGVRASLAEVDAALWHHRACVLNTDLERFSI
jgi:lipoyl(octanoyl) transferase